MPDRTPLPIDALQLQTISEEGKVPRTRVKDAASAYGIYQQLRRADSTSAANRAAIQAMFDGEPPYNDQDLVETGQGFRTNVNFDEAGTLLEQAMSSYVDMLHSVENLFTVKLNDTEPTEAAKLEAIIAEEGTRTFREWKLFNFAFLENCRNFIADGVSICYFENELDWRWRVSAMKEFFFPRRTQASEGELEIACCERYYQAHQLYAFIEDEQVASDSGWNVSQVKKAITHCAQNTSQAMLNYSDWEELQRQLKNNDLYYSATSAEVKVVHMWVQEFDQTVSHLIFLADGSPDDFLYKKLSRFNSMDEALVFFTYGIGTNGYYHSIRGLGYKVFPQVQASNRLRCQMIDSAMMSSSLMVQPMNEEAAEDLSLLYYGPMAVITPGVKFVDRAIPNLSQSAIPVLGDMMNQLQARTGQYTHNALADSRERTKFEVATQLDSATKLSITAMNLFYEPWQRLIKEAFRRLIRSDYTSVEPGGREAMRFRTRLAKRGVSLEILSKIDFGATRIVRAVGAGSQAARQMVFSELDAVSSAMDEAGRNQYLRERIASRVGWDQVDKYIPPTNEARPTDDDRFAEIENQLMLRDGAPMTVRPNDNHIVHLRQHIRAMDEIVTQLDQGAIPLAQAAQSLLLPHQHSIEHIQQAAGNVLAGDELSAFNKRLQQLGEIVYNGLEQLQAEQRKNGTQGGQQTNPEQEKFNQELQRRIITHQTQLKFLAEKHQLNMKLKYEDAQQKKLLADAQTAAKIARSNP